MDEHSVCSLDLHTFSSPAAVAYVYCKPTKNTFAWELGKVDGRDPSALPVQSRRLLSSGKLVEIILFGSISKQQRRRLKERAGAEAQNSEMRKVFCDCLFLWLWSPSFISLAPSADLPADLTSFHPSSLALFPGKFAQVKGASTRLSACVIPPLMSRGGWQNSSPVVSCLRVQMCGSSCSNMDKIVAATLFLVLLYAVANPCCGKGYESVNRIMFSL